VFEKVRSMCHPKIEVEFYDFMDGVWVRFDWLLEARKNKKM
jgi:hypothetical protein